MDRSAAPGDSKKMQVGATPPSGSPVPRPGADQERLPMRRVKDKPPAKKDRAWAALFLALLAGAVTLLHFSERFVFYYEETYTRIALWSCLAFVPLALYRMKSAPGFAGRLAKKYPTAWLRNWLVMPLMAVFAAGLVWMAPLGWLLAAACLTGGATQHVHALAVQVDAPASSKGCDQYAKLRFASIEKRTCIAGRQPAASMRTGQVLDVGIRAFSFGFLIDSIAPAQAGLN